MGPQCVRLTHPPSGSFADILVGLGNNCFQWTVCSGPVQHSILWSHPEYAQGTQRPAGSGIPILFPFPGRLAGTSWNWQGTTYSLPAGDPLGNAIHGLVVDQPWRIVQHETNRLVAEFQGTVDSMPGHWSWPADARLRAAYLLQARSLTCHFQVHNPDRRPLPWGLGLHPYFRLPETSRPDQITRLQMPVDLHFQLDRMLPTGQACRSELAESIARGMPLASPLDDVFSVAQTDASGWQARLDPAGAPWQLTMDVDSQLPYAVLFTPPHGQAICMEPYSCVPGAASVPGREAQLGWQTLAPGQTAWAQVRLEVRGI